MKKCALFSLFIVFGTLMSSDVFAAKAWPMVCRGGNTAIKVLNRTITKRTVVENDSILGDLFPVLASDFETKRVRSVIVEFKIKKGRHAGRRGRLRPGECAFFDRGIRRGEPRTLRYVLPKAVMTGAYKRSNRNGYSISIQSRHDRLERRLENYLEKAKDRNEYYYVRVYNNRKGVFLITELNP